MMVSCKSRMLVPSVKVRVKVGCSSMVSIKASVETNTTEVVVFLSAFLIP